MRSRGSTSARGPRGPASTGRRGSGEDHQSPKLRGMKPSLTPRCEGLRVGDVITASFPPGRGAEKGKQRPAVVARVGGPTCLVFPLTDARKKVFPTHARLPDYPSGSQTKDALVTCEHAWSLDPSRLSPRQGARPLNRLERSRVKMALSVTLGLFPIRPPPTHPAEPRGSWVWVDFGSGPASEATGPSRAVVISNDVGNYFGRTLLVVPCPHHAPHLPVDLAGTTVDLGRIRVVDRERLMPEPAEPIPSHELVSLEAHLRSTLLDPWMN